MSTTDDRRFEILRAIVTDYVDTQEPIGSKALVERHQLGVSSATVRNDMAVLEAEGYITQPHTSSGRIPTEKGYREFVDRLDGVKPMSAPERRAILDFLDSGVDLDDVLRRAVRLLAQLTRQVAVVQYPTLSASTVRHLEVVALTPARLLLVVITDSGRVDQRIVELGNPLDEHQLAQLRDLLGKALDGKRLSAASIAVADLAGQLVGGDRNQPMGAGNPLADAIGRAATAGPLAAEPESSLVDRDLVLGRGAVGDLDAADEVGAAGLAGSRGNRKPRDPWQHQDSLRVTTNSRRKNLLLGSFDKNQQL